MNTIIPAFKTYREFWNRLRLSLEPYDKSCYQSTTTLRELYAIFSIRLVECIIPNELFLFFEENIEKVPKTVICTHWLYGDHYYHNQFITNEGNTSTNSIVNSIVNSYNKKQDCSICNKTKIINLDSFRCFIIRSSVTDNQLSDYESFIGLMMSSIKPRIVYDVISREEIYHFLALNKDIFIKYNGNLQPQIDILDKLDYIVNVCPAWLFGISHSEFCFHCKKMNILTEDKTQGFRPNFTLSKIIEYAWPQVKQSCGEKFILYLRIINFYICKNKKIVTYNSKLLRHPRNPLPVKCGYLYHIFKKCATGFSLRIELIELLERICPDHEICLFWFYGKKHTNCKKCIDTFYYLKSEIEQSSDNKPSDTNLSFYYLIYFNHVNFQKNCIYDNVEKIVLSGSLQKLLCNDGNRLSDIEEFQSRSKYLKLLYDHDSYPLSRKRI